MKRPDMRMIATLGLVVVLTAACPSNRAPEQQGVTSPTPTGSRPRVPLSSATLLTLTDEAREFEIDYPRGWHTGFSVPHLGAGPGKEWERVSIATFPIRPGGCSGSFSEEVLADLPTEGAFLSVQERVGDTELHGDARPRSFATSKETGDSSTDCAPKQKRYRHWWLYFEEKERAFHIFVAAGIDVTQETLQQVWAILDSMRIGQLRT